MTALWTMYFVLALVLLTTLTFTASLTAKEAFGGDWNPYFLLLGGPFAAAVAAKGIVTAKVQKDPTAKTNTAAASATAVPTETTTPAEATAADLIMNDDGDTDLVDTQYALFTLVAVAYFVGTLVVTTLDYLHGSRAVVGLPQIPSRASRAHQPVGLDLRRQQDRDLRSDRHALLCVAMPSTAKNQPARERPAPPTGHLEVRPGHRRTVPLRHKCGPRGP